MVTTIISSFLLFVSSSALAAKINQATCSDLRLRNHKTVTPQYLAEIEGFNKNGKQVYDEIDTENIMNKSENIDIECAKDLFANVNTVRKASQAPSSALQGKKKYSNTKIRPLQSNCEGFLKLDEELRPLAVHWIAGHEKFGKLSRHDEFDVTFLELPVSDLVAQCRAQPNSSFFSQTKAWLKKQSSSQ